MAEEQLPAVDPDDPKTRRKLAAIAERRRNRQRAGMSGPVTAEEREALT
jgi:hypothetical protein